MHTYFDDFFQLNYDSESGLCDLVLVEFLDWGMTHWVDLSEVRLLPPSPSTSRLYTVPRLAKCCTLNRIYPLPDIIGSVESVGNAFPPQYYHR